MVVFVGTNQYNFKKAKKPAPLEPTNCSGCGAVIPLAEGGYSVRGGNDFCEPCTLREFPDLQQ